MKLKTFKMDKKKTLAVAAAALLVAAAAVALGGKKGKAMPAGMPGGGMEDAIPTVSVVTPELGSIQLYTSLTGEVEPSDVVYVYAKAGGDVIDVLVKAGDTVTEGQVLMTIDTDQVDTARNSMESALVSYEQAQDTLNRQQIVYASGGISEQSYQQYVNSAKTAKLQYESAKMAYERQVKYSTITAPIGGVVESCGVEVHDQVSQSTQLCVISGAGSKRLSFQVTEKVKEHLETGDAVEVQKNGKTYTGTITEVSSMTDSSTGLYKVKAEFDGADSLSTGSVVKLTLVSQDTLNAMTVPVDTIYFTGSENYVYVYEEGVVHRAPLEIGIYDSELAEVLSGLSWEDQVVSTWSADLYENAKVKLSSAETATPSDAPETGQREDGRYGTH